jgi:KilA-N domain
LNTSLIKGGGLYFQKNNPPMLTNKKITVKGTEITVFKRTGSDFISLTDIARYKNPEHTDDIVKNWLRNRNTIELLGFWELMHNPAFKPVEFDGFKKQAGLNSFALTPKKWIESTRAIGLISKQGKYGGTFAHRDIAFEFASWVSVEFKLYIIKEFQRLKEEENSVKQLNWDLQRTLAKINYRIHTDAIRDELVPPAITREQKNAIYASEADLLNMALFGQTAGHWRMESKQAAGNIRDHATLEQLVILTNLESLNAILIKQGLSQADRLQKLNEIAISQMKSLLNYPQVKQLKNVN